MNDVQDLPLDRVIQLHFQDGTTRLAKLKIIEQYDRFDKYKQNVPAISFWVTVTSDKYLEEREPEVIVIDESVIGWTEIKR